MFLLISPSLGPDDAVNSWDKAYSLELENYESNPEDTGTVWFSDNSASEKILAYLTSSSLALDRDATFIDLGTGNGEMLFLLREDGGFTGRMLGVDYSPLSVELARNVAKDRNLTGLTEFEVWDILGDTVGPPGHFNVVLDKGTFDAVSLSGQTGVEEKYVQKAKQLVRNGGLLLITSCNWTESELRNWFEGGPLKYYDKIEYPVFSFGGQTGQSISSICFRKDVR